MDIHYKQLQTFLQVAQTGSFRSTSAQIHRSFSVVSAQIRQLEDQLGVSLFQRTTRSVKLTVAGELLRGCEGLAGGAVSRRSFMVRTQGGRRLAQLRDDRTSTPMIAHFMNEGRVLAVGFA